MLAKPTALEQVKIEDVIKELGLPSSAKFIGYVIHRPDTDEFAAQAVETEDESYWAWAKHPHYANLFYDYPDAYKLAAQYTKAPVIVGLMFDLGKEYFFAGQVAD